MDGFGEAGTVLTKLERCSSMDAFLKGRGVAAADAPFRASFVGRVGVRGTEGQSKSVRGMARVAISCRASTKQRMPGNACSWLSHLGDAGNLWGWQPPRGGKLSTIYYDRQDLSCWKTVVALEGLGAARDACARGVRNRGIWGLERAKSIDCGSQPSGTFCVRSSNRGMHALIRRGCRK